MAQKIAVIVLGPLDRSPRMLNHAISISQNTKLKVDFIGYKGSSMPHKLEELENKVNIIHLQTDLIDIFKKLPKAFYLLYAVIRIIYQVLQMIGILVFGNYDFILVQNPPCIPLLFVIWIYCKILQLPALMLLSLFKKVEYTKLIIDWHNYGFTILQSVGSNKLLVILAKYYEIFFGNWAHHNLAVSHQFKKNISKEIGVNQNKISVLYDRAVSGKFKELSLNEKHQFFKIINLENIFTEEVDGQIQYKKDRPLLMITSTSYTPDEDLGLLIESLKKFGDLQSQNELLPKIHLIVTGAGPQKQLFLKKFEEFNKNQKKTKIEAKWLEIDDYPKMIGSADLGICMHMSSSGLDLPMKVVDMFSCKVPSFAYQYPAITELVKPAFISQEKSTIKYQISTQPNGALFQTEKDLVDLLVLHFGKNLDDGLFKLQQYKDNLDSFVNETWDDHWNEVMMENQNIFQFLKQDKKKR